MFALCNPDMTGLLQGEHPEILAQSDLPPLDLSAGDIRSQIPAEWLQIAQPYPSREAVPIPTGAIPTSTIPTVLIPTCHYP